MKATQAASIWTFQMRKANGNLSINVMVEIGSALQLNYIFIHISCSLYSILLILGQELSTLTDATFLA